MFEKPAKKNGACSFASLHKPGLFGKALCLGFPVFTLPAMLLNAAPQPVGVLLQLLYAPVALKLFPAPYLLLRDQSISLFSAWQGSVLLTKRRIFGILRMIFSFWWTVLPACIVFFTGALLYVETEPIAPLLFTLLATVYLTEILAGPYLFLCMTELAIYLCTPSLQDQTETASKKSVGIADRIYARMQRLHGVELDVAESDGGELEDLPDESG